MSRFLESGFGVKKNGLRKVTSAVLVAGAMVSLLLSGCVAPGYSEEKEMLFEDKIHVEPRIGTFIPSEGDFSNGVIIGGRISFQYDYGAYVSFEVQATEEVEQEANAPTVTNTNQIRDLEHLALSEADRRSFVISFDWDYPFSEDDSVPYIRWGLGLGVLHTLNGTNPSVRTDLLALGTPVLRSYAKDSTMILVRPTIGLHWEPIDDLTLFVDAQYDYAQSKAAISLDGDDRKTGVIDHGGINFLFGLSYSF